MNEYRANNGSFQYGALIRYLCSTRQATLEASHLNRVRCTIITDDAVLVDSHAADGELLVNTVVLTAEKIHHQGPARWSAPSLAFFQLSCQHASKK